MANTETMTIKDGLGANQIVPVHPADGGDAIQTVVSLDGDVATYSAGGTILAANMAASLTDLIALVGSATKTVRVQKVRVECGATTGATVPITIKKHTVANSGGTKATAPGIAKLDSEDAVATAVVDVYTANPTVDATAVPVVGRNLVTTALTTAPGVAEVDFLRDLGHALVLRGIAQEMAVNFGGTTPGAGAVLSWSITWTEE